MDGYLTTEQLAARLGVKRQTVHKYRARGDIPPPDQYAGRTPLWSATKVEKWVEQRPSSGWKRRGTETS
jgi:excisionase family DNA binding protein